ncbi:MAG TPA: radical SAM protein [Acidocella sp.]|nr:radical SAM protein [Acidocella sp.]
MQATQALLQQAELLGISAANLICTGDIIAYGADAKATLDLVRQAGVTCLMGNCELSLGRKADDCGCGFAPGSVCDALSAYWYAHAAAEIDDVDRSFMAGLPQQIELSLEGKKLRFVHGNLDRVNAFVFPSVSNLELQRQLALSGCDAVIAGHSGIPFTRHIGDKIWHNAGSIGMPANDGTPRGWFSLIDVRDGDLVISSQPLRYDYHAAAQSIRQARLPEPYAAALETGIWPSLDILPAADRYFTGIPLEARAITEPTPSLRLQELRTLWVNTGTLCNLACTKCFMDSSPLNDALAYFQYNDFIEILDHAPSSVVEIGFTGGEPFMNPEIIPMITAALQAGKHALVLTNGMRPMRRHEETLTQLGKFYPEQLNIRVSLDHYDREQHEALRGPASFLASLEGLKFLQRAGLNISVAARTPWGETEAMMRAGFADLFAEHNIEIDAQNQAGLILFPEMDSASPVSLPVTQAALGAVPADKPLMCLNSRMVVRRKGVDYVSFTPCTLLPNEDLGATLPAAGDLFSLNHPHCGQFCVYGGASCVGAPG